MNAFNEPSKFVTTELKIKRSLFIANLKPCHDEFQARNFLNEIISLHHDANHNCRAYIFDSGQEYFSDDGEPSGTAGRPILNAIKQSKILNVMIIVTRYFGGVKLGVRGLIDAYGEAAKTALNICEPVKKILTKNLKLSFEYNSMGLIKKIFEAHNAQNLKLEYLQRVNLNADVPADEFENILKQLDELNARGIIKYES